MTSSARARKSRPTNEEVALTTVLTVREMIDGAIERMLEPSTILDTTPRSPPPVLHNAPRPLSLVAKAQPVGRHSIRGETADASLTTGSDPEAGYSAAIRDRGDELPRPPHVLGFSEVTS